MTRFTVINPNVLRRAWYAVKDFDGQQIDTNISHDEQRSQGNAAAPSHYTDPRYELF